MPLPSALARGASYGRILRGNNPIAPVNHFAGGVRKASHAHPISSNASQQSQIIPGGPQLA